MIKSVYICSVLITTINIKIMKMFSEMRNKDPWWVILLKVLAYAIGLIIAGIGTIEAANIVGIIK